MKSGFVAGMFLILASAAHAGLSGSSVSEVYDYPTLGAFYDFATYAPATFTVGAGEESVVDVEGVTDIHVDFANKSLALVFNTVLSHPTWSSTSFNGVVFSGTGLGKITSVAVAPGSTFAGFDASRAALAGNDLRLNWQDLSYVDGTTLGLTFGTVPEPASWALMIAGFGLVGSALRRQSRALAA